jgi:hypothetical protein
MPLNSCPLKNCGKLVVHRQFYLVLPATHSVVGGWSATRKFRARYFRIAGDSLRTWHHAKGELSSRLIVVSDIRGVTVIFDDGLANSHAFVTDIDAG